MEEPTITIEPKRSEQKRAGLVLAERAGSLARSLSDAEQAARNLRDRCLTIERLGVRDGDVEYLAAERDKLTYALDSVRESEPGGTEEEDAGYVTGYAWKWFLQ